MGEAAFSSMYGCTADVGLTASAQPKPLEAQQPPFCPLSQEARWSSRSLVTKLQFMCVSNQTRFCTLARDTTAKVTSISQRELKQMEPILNFQMPTESLQLAILLHTQY